MKIKFRNYLLLALFTVLCFTLCLAFLFAGKNAEAQSNEDINCGENYVCCDIIDGATTGSCYPNDEISALVLDNTLCCNEYCSSHGPGREKGGTGILNSGCRNYMRYKFNYGSTDIPYWINMDVINNISNAAHRQKIVSDIRIQTEMWNHACMYDGTGQIVNIYEVNANSSKPSEIDGNKVIEVLPYDLTQDPDHSTAAGLFSPSDRTVKLKYSNNQIGYNIDTVVHEFGHVLGLDDIDSGSGEKEGTHKTLMGYLRIVTAATLNKAIKYPDVQGIAVATGRHFCQDSHFMRYVKVGNEYRHICFYCDRVNNRTSIISGSQAIASNVNCEHDYKAMVSCGQRRWEKCTKCYNVIEINGVSGTGDKVTLRATGNITTYSYTLAEYGKPMPEVDIIAPKKEGYVFDGYYDYNGKQYYKMEPKVDEESDMLHSMPYYPCVEKVVPVPGVTWDHTSDTTLYARWKLIECDYTYQIWCDGNVIDTATVHLTSGLNRITPKNVDGYNFVYFQYYGQQVSSVPAEIEIALYYDYRGLIDEDARGDQNYSDGIFLKYITSEVKLKYDRLVAYYNKACVAQGSLITLADGSQVAVENLTGNEMLLVWNLYTGTYDTAPILFIDSDPLQLYKVINLSFSDGTTVKVISEHGFWDYNLNKYVYLDGNAADYIGHWFNKGATRVQLTGVEITEEYTTPYSPVTYGHLCYYVNGMLSMPGGIGGLFNIFDVDSETMRYDEAAMAADIEQYGLFTYEDFAELVPVSEEVFDAFNGRYLKVAIGKGLIDTDRLAALAERYQEFFV